MSPTTRARAGCSASRCWADPSASMRSVGDVIVVSIKEAIPRGRVKKGDVHQAVIVRTAKEIRRTDGSLDPLRPQRGGADQQAGRADRHPHLRPGDPRAAGQEVHEDHLAGAGSAVSDGTDDGDSAEHGDEIEDQEGRQGGRHHRSRQGQDRRDPAGHARGEPRGRAGRQHRQAHTRASRCSSDRRHRARRKRRSTSPMWR